MLLTILFPPFLKWDLKENLGTGGPLNLSSMAAKSSSDFDPDLGFNKKRVELRSQGPSPSQVQGCVNNKKEKR